MTRNAEDKLEIPFIEVAQRCYRLIPSKFPPIDVYRFLESDEIKDAAVRLESLTNPRLAAKGRLGASPNPTERSPRLQNWNHAPFAYPNPEGSRYLGPEFGVMDVALNEQAAMRMAVLRRETFLRRTKEAAAGYDMRVLGTPVRGRFADLTSEPLDMPRDSRWAKGKQLHASRIDGIAHRLPDAGRATFLAIINPEIIELSEQETHYRFVWDGKSIRSVYNFSNGEETSRETIFFDDPNMKAA